jgi:hypothetical protein
LFVIGLLVLFERIGNYLADFINLPFAFGYSCRVGGGGGVGRTSASRGFGSLVIGLIFIWLECRFQNLAGAFESGSYPAPFNLCVCFWQAGISFANAFLVGLFCFHLW